MKSAGSVQCSQPTLHQASIANPIHQGSIANPVHQGNIANCLYQSSTANQEFKFLNVGYRGNPLEFIKCLRI